MRHPISRLIWVQFAASFAAYLLLLLLGTASPESGLAGGMIAAAANAFAAWRVFSGSEPEQPRVAEFYMAAIGKLILVAGLFALTINYLEPLNGVALFGVFFAVQMVPVFMPGKLGQHCENGQQG